MKTMIKTLSTLALIGMSVGLSTAQADVQYRIGYEEPTNQYAVYMTPDSVPMPDFSLTAQVTVKAPHTENSRDFVVSNIQSHVEGALWSLHSQTNSPSESRDAKYLSFGMALNGSTAPVFAWEPGIERKVFTFQADAGCRNGVALMENADPFAQLPNSKSVNPGNQFTNLGWASANSYTGSYGGAVSCQADEVVTKLCPRAEQRKLRIDRQVDRLELSLERLKQWEMSIKRRLDLLALSKQNVANMCF